MDVVIASSIDAFARDEWNRLFPHELEDWSYYRAVERAGLTDFDYLYFALRENGVLRAVVPAFLTDYRLDTTLQGGLRKITDAISRVFPRLLRLRLLSLGSPVSEVCHLGFAPDCNRAEQTRLLAKILAKVEQEAQARRIGMVAIKDAGEGQDDLWAEACAVAGLRRQPGLPTASLDLPYKTLDDYLAALSSGTRKDMRRKLKNAAALRIEWRDNIDDIRDDVLRLYRATFDHAEFQFEELTPAYFQNVLSELGDRASCVTYWLDQQLIAFNLVLHDERRLLDKFFGMDYALARKYSLYYVSWMENVRYCLAQDIPVYQSGQGLHHEKLRLGSRLAANWLWYRHRNRLLDRIFAVVERLFRLDRLDTDLAHHIKEPNR